MVCLLQLSNFHTRVGWRQHLHRTSQEGHHREEGRDNGMRVYAHNRKCDSLEEAKKQMEEVIKSGKALEKVVDRVLYFLQLTTSSAPKKVYKKYRTLTSCAVLLDVGRAGREQSRR